ncbi:MAG TPA: methyltransferase domain-containing protein [Pyrinomonadaceae bacterium]|nr:methyltransferase domain-containing protein [Pyrinomonadaceae bacterium]
MKEHTYPIMFRIEQSHWWYTGRRKILTRFVEDICHRVTDRRPRILDVGCGTGANLLMLSQFGDAEGVDVSEDALAFCRERGLENVKLGAAEKLPYDDGTFDLVTALDVVEHLDDDLAGLREMRRVLRPGGRVLLFVPTFMFLWGLQDDVSNHRRRYRMPELGRVLEQAGFEIERTTYANITFFMPILAMRKLMRLTGIKAESENNINVSALNGVLARVLGAESYVLRYMNIPFGVSGLCVARTTD